MQWWNSFYKSLPTGAPQKYWTCRSGSRRCCKMKVKRCCKKILFSFLLVMLFCPLFSETSFYWETPRAISSSDSRFPIAVSNDNAGAILFEEVGKSDIWINIITRDADGQWGKPHRIAGPFFYSGDVPDLFSAALSPAGTIAVAVLMNQQTVGVYVSHDGGKNFTLKELPRQTLPVVGPRIFYTKNGGFMLFTALGENESFTLLTSRSEDGDEWTRFSEFSPAKKHVNPFAPYLVSLDDRDVVVFQTQYNSGVRLSYQL